MNEIEELLIKIQPLYDKLNSKFSKSYLSGSIWYVGDDLLIWWKNCSNIRVSDYIKNKNKVKEILNILLIENYDNSLKTNNCLTTC